MEQHPLHRHPLRTLFTNTGARSRRASSWDRRGGNRDFFVVRPGETATLLEHDGPGCLTHLYCALAFPENQLLVDAFGHDVILHRDRTLLRQLHVVFQAADAIGMAGDDDGTNGDRAAGFVALAENSQELVQILFVSGGHFSFVELDALQLDLLLDSVLSGDLVRLVAAFNAAIEQEIRGEDSLGFEPAGLATAKGFQTGEMLEQPSYATGLLAMMINGAVRGYIDGLPDDPDHPFVAAAPARWTLNGWGVILQAQGHQRAHIHPSGWLSGVYYVRVPRAVGSASQQGWIEFGEPPANIGCRRVHQTRRVAPEAGRMLLFPSYVYHRTIPFQDSENRISFAFDVVPLKG